MNKFSMSLLTIYENGARAVFDGKPMESCPYHGRTGFNGQRRDYWHQGFNAAKSGKSILDERGEIRTPSHEH